MGGQPTERQEADERRTAFLEQRGYRVIRFWNDPLFNHLPEVLEMIRLNLA